MGYLRWVLCVGCVAACSSRPLESFGDVESQAHAEVGRCSPTRVPVAIAPADEDQLAPAIAGDTVAYVVGAAHGQQRLRLHRLSDGGTTLDQLLGRDDATSAAVATQLGGRTLAVSLPVGPGTTHTGLFALDLETRQLATLRTDAASWDLTFSVDASGSVVWSAGNAVQAIYRRDPDDTRSQVATPARHWDSEYNTLALRGDELLVGESYTDNDLGCWNAVYLLGPGGLPTQPVTRLSCAAEAQPRYAVGLSQARLAGGWVAWTAARVDGARTTPTAFAFDRQTGDVVALPFGAAGAGGDWICGRGGAYNLATRETVPFAVGDCAIDGGKMVFTKENEAGKQNVYCVELAD